MFEDERPKPKTTTFPRNLESLSVDELEHYIVELEGEIARVRTDIDKKQATKAAADAFFGS
jgi:uncharacterized small protein (DUF1192 family)